MARRFAAEKVEDQREQGASLGRPIKRCQVSWAFLENMGFAFHICVSLESEVGAVILLCAGITEMVKAEELPWSH